MSSILSNVSALGASRQLHITSQGLEQTIQRLTTGRRINRASDDAAGLGISNKLHMDVRIANQAKRNANDGTTYLQVADGVLDELTNLLNRGAELAEQAKTGTLSNTNRQSIDAEFQNILATIIDIGLSTTFNGQTIFGTTTTVAVGSYSPITLSVATVSTSATQALGLTRTTDTLSSTTGASTAQTRLAGALDSVSNIRATLGATMQQLGAVSNVLGIQAANITAAFSQIHDANLADEVVSLTKFQILSQSGTNALSQANQAQQQILSLLR